MGEEGKEVESMTKRIWIPGYVRANGNIVNGHYREMTEGKETRSRAATKGWKELKQKRTKRKKGRRE